MEEQDATKVNCYILIPKLDSQYGPDQAFFEHLTTMAHHAKKENQQISTGDNVTHIWLDIHNHTFAYT